MKAFGTLISPEVEGLPMPTRYEMVQAWKTNHSGTTAELTEQTHAWMDLVFTDLENMKHDYYRASNAIGEIPSAEDVNRFAGNYRGDYLGSETDRFILSKRQPEEEKLRVVLRTLVAFLDSMMPDFKQEMLRRAKAEERERKKKLKEESEHDILP